MSDDDFNSFFAAYSNHQNAERIRLSIHKASDISTQNKTEQSNNSKLLQCNEFVMHQGRKASMSNYINPTKCLSISHDKSLTSKGSEFKLIPLPTKNMLNVINGLKEIEDEIEDNE